MDRTHRQSLATFALCLAAGLSAASAVGCRVTDTDVRRWETTELGPDKLVAVMTHDKYEWPLRVDAAAALIRMKPRAGRRIGIPKLQDAMFTLPPDDKKKLASGLIPVIVGEMDKPPVQAQGMAPGEAKGDPSVPYKDAAYGLLNYDKGVLVADDTQKKTLQDALVRWATSDFEHRIAISSQMYGLEQVFRSLGPDGVRALPALIKSPNSSGDAALLGKIVALIAELGDQPTKDAASKALVTAGTQLESAAWIQAKKPEVKRLNDEAGYKIDDAKLTQQVVDYQEEIAASVYASMRKIGGRPVIDYLLAAGADTKRTEKRRQTALAALEGKLDRNNPNDVNAVLKIAGAGDDTPDSVKQQAFLRIAELPREMVASKLYDLFNKDPKKWKIRWVAASTILKMSAAKDMPEFMGKLPANPAPGFSISEPLEYGGLLGKMNPPVKKEDMIPYLKSAVLTQKATALGYFYAYGKASDVATIQPLETDTQAVPKNDDPDAKWQCGVPKAGGKAGETEMKDITTVGDYVKNCVEPPMQARK
jgi:hypothetical protein